MKAVNVSTRGSGEISSIRGIRREERFQGVDPREFRESKKSHPTRECSRLLLSSVLELESLRVCFRRGERDIRTLLRR